jgi:hypothetical protein
MISLARHSLRLLLCLAIGLVLQLHAATAKDMQGEWMIDGAATWEAMKKMPQFAAAPADKLKAMEPMVIAQLSAMTCTVTADKIVSSGGPQPETETYRVLGIDGNTIKTESTNAKGVTEKTDVLVKGDSLVLTYPGQEGKMLVMKRKPAAK